MAGQLNPAWRRKTSSREHLDHISERFLSDNPGTGKGNAGCRLIPFLPADESQHWVIRDLCTLLNQRGHRSVLCSFDERHGGLSVAAEEKMEAATDAEFCLLAIDSPDIVKREQLDHLVVLVPSSLEAVREAYRKIKWLAEGGAPEIGVVVIGPRDQHAAWRYFRKLAVGTLRYLDVPLLNLGFLPVQVTPAGGQADHHRTNFLTRISERLLRSEFYARRGTAAEQ